MSSTLTRRRTSENVTVDPGAALGLLSSGEVDAALLFSGQTASAMALRSSTWSSASRRTGRRSLGRGCS